MKAVQIELLAKTLGLIFDKDFVLIYRDPDKDAVNPTQMIMGLTQDEVIRLLKRVLPELEKGAFSYESVTVKMK